MAGYRELQKKKAPPRPMPEEEDTMMAQSGIKPAPEMVQMAKDMAKTMHKKMMVKPKKK